MVYTAKDASTLERKISTKERSYLHSIRVISNRANEETKAVFMAGVAIEKLVPSTHRAELSDICESLCISSQFWQDSKW